MTFRKRIQSGRLPLLILIMAGTAFAHHSLQCTITRER